MEDNNKKTISSHLEEIKNLAASLTYEKPYQDKEEKLVEMITGILTQKGSKNLKMFFKTSNFVIKSLKPKSGLYIDYVSRQIARILTGKNEILVIYLDNKYKDEQSCNEFLPDFFVLLKKLNVKASFNKKETAHLPCEIILRHTHN